MLNLKIVLEGSLLVGQLLDAEKAKFLKILVNLKETHKSPAGKRAFMRSNSTSDIKFFRTLPHVTKYTDRSMGWPSIVQK